MRSRCFSRSARAVNSFTLLPSDRSFCTFLTHTNLRAGGAGGACWAGRGSVRSFGSCTRAPTPPKHTHHPSALLTCWGRRARQPSCSAAPSSPGPCVPAQRQGHGHKCGDGGQGRRQRIVPHAAIQLGLGRPLAATIPGTNGCQCLAPMPCSLARPHHLLGLDALAIILTVVAAVTAVTLPFAFLVFGLLRLLVAPHVAQRLSRAAAGLSEMAGAGLQQVVERCARSKHYAVRPI